MFDTIILTCEHAGNVIPEPYKFPFEGHQEVLTTHRAIDFGAFELAKGLEHYLDVPLFYTTICRLLIENNRSLNSSELFSEFTIGLTNEEKENLITNYYGPYRNQVEEEISKHIQQHHRLAHISVHSFTPTFNGTIRNTDIGLLYDPSRIHEKVFCDRLTEEITKLDPSVVVKHNYPYLGIDDGLTTHFRQKYSDDQYAGIELEVNQKFVLDKDETAWENLKKVLTVAIHETLGLVYSK